MNFSLPAFIGWRYFRFRALVTLISVGGVTLGCAVLIIVLSVMNGFSTDLKDRLLSVVPHLLVESKDRQPFELSADLRATLGGDPRIADWASLVEGECLIQSERGLAGAIVKGIDFSNARKREAFNKHLLEGEGFLQQGAAERKIPPIILGDQLAAQLKVYLGDTLSLVSPIEKEGPLGTLPLTRRFEVIGIHQLGVVEYDAKYAYIPLAEAQKFFFGGVGISAIELFLSDADDAASVARKMNSHFGASGWVARSWEEMHQHLFAALRLEKIAMFLILSCIILVASFNIIGSLAMSVVDQQKAISILMAMGAARSAVRSIFIIEGSFIGLIGTLLGLMLGGGVCFLLKNYPLIQLPDLYVVRTLPVLVTPGYFIGVGLTALCIVLLATWFPANAAAKINPLEGIRYE